MAKAAHNVKEACRLIGSGWKCQTGEYADGGKTFAEPKDPLASERQAEKLRLPAILNMEVRGDGV